MRALQPYRQIFTSNTLGWSNSQGAYHAIDLGKDAKLTFYADGRVFFVRKDSADRFTPIEVNNKEMFIAALPKPALLMLCRAPISVLYGEPGEWKREALSRIGSLRELTLLALAEDDKDDRVNLLDRINVIKDWKKNMEGRE